MLLPISVTGNTAGSLPTYTYMRIGTDPLIGRESLEATALIIMLRGSRSQQLELQDSAIETIESMKVIESIAEQLQTLSLLFYVTDPQSEASDSEYDRLDSESDMIYILGRKRNQAT